MNTQLGRISVLVSALLLLCFPEVSRSAPQAGDAGSAEKPDDGAAVNKGTAAAEKPAPLFDGRTLDGWKVTDFAGHGEVRVNEGQIILERGETLTGVTWTREFPKTDYEVQLEAKRVDGSDFFCGMTFRVGDQPCSLIVGGWGGAVVGLSSIENRDASENETTRFLRFESGRWYPIRLRVTREKIEAWIDGRQVVDVARNGREFSVRIEVEPSQPFGIASWRTTAALRNITLKRLKAESK